MSTVLYRLNEDVFEDIVFSSSPCPDLLNLQGKRWVCGSEPEKNKINGGFVKFLTGNDKISGRYCHQNPGVNFYPQHSLAIQCNAIPSLDGEDDAIWDRGRIIDFLYKFVDEPVGDFQRKIDRGLKEKVKTWGPQFMLILLEWYKIVDVIRRISISTVTASASTTTSTSTFSGTKQLANSFITKSFVGHDHFNAYTPPSKGT
ncbi:hypothetical protein BDK51DRAFT_30175 [Blyttiomyces helicus]|uniref:Uncharacterized protein n=1 Tax=Blyttiomyces helicus TaxID=388810 RepID=A0A4P9WGG2_9FUNG|nr:hypothetical protein BDK51DRAFT_30175 [Blyttiomyces helicus]|eukprot:RKO90448.1 hypothetical protein BDK51DRAFT_30175 [Blyttiomyces helicus]